MSSVAVIDLIGRPYKRGGCDVVAGIDCRALAFTAAARIPLVGIPDAHAAEQSSYDWVTQGRSPWKRIGDEVTSATKLGHLVLVGDGETEAGAMLLVNEEERLFLTTSARMGRSRLVRSQAVRNIIGVFEWEPEA